MEFVFIIIILILSVVIHELAHGYSALAQGDPTAKYAGRLTMNPLKHLDLVGSFIVPFILFILPTNLILGWAKPVPYNPYNLRNQKWGEAIVAVAGPLSNMIIALFFGIFIQLGYGIFPIEVIYLSGLIIIINIFLAIFNLIPIPPLDGSKILFSLLPQSFSVSESRLFLERYGLIIVIFAVFLLGGVIFPAIFFILYLLFDFLTGGVITLPEVLNNFF